MFLDHQLLINLLSSRNIVYTKDKEQSLFDDIDKKLSKYNINDIFLNNYMDINFSRDQFENHITSFFNC